MDGGPAMSGIVLCGGAGTRMGADKASLLVEGRTLLERAVSTLEACASPVLVAAGATGLKGYRCVLDEEPGRGPLAGIVAGLAASQHELCAVIAVDMPDADAALLQCLARLRSDEDALIPCSDRGMEPLHAVYARSALPALRAALTSGDLSITAAVRRLRSRLVDGATLGARPGFACNLNTSSELTAWTRRSPEYG
jgi:molybdopterin-guanine dinucleotide biosynthesis protein A